MSLLFITATAALVFLLAYRFYGGFLAKKVFCLNDARSTPAVLLQDGLDYEPTAASYLFGQHFSAIAAAGPITGPILACLMFGWAPALAWIVIGAVFVGGVHDMGALIASVRHQGQSITEVVRRNVSQRAWLVFMVFIWITLVYIIVAFTDITSSSFVGTITLENGSKVGGGAIATSSLLYMFLPVLMGLLLRFTKLSLTQATLIFLPLLGAAIWAGPLLPFDLGALLGTSQASAQKLWNVLILTYCLIAAVAPVWALLQPRGHLGGWFLYLSLAASLIGILCGGFTVQYPAFTKPLADGLEGFFFPMFPVLFITVACGACSGFHSLVSSGTSSKQLRKESDAKLVGYGAMLLESLVAVAALGTVMILSKNDALAGKAPNFIYASGIGKFLELIGIPASFGISFGLMAFTTFVYDTLDICTRLGRYIIEELTGWRSKAGRLFATALTAGVPLLFVTMTALDAQGRPAPAWKVFWNVFGASNQLLAGLSLLGVSVWVFSTSQSKSKAWLAPFLPAVWMFVMSGWAILGILRAAWWKSGQLVLTAAPVPWVCLLLLLLSLMLAFETSKALRRKTAGQV